MDNIIIKSPNEQNLKVGDKIRAKIISFHKRGIRILGINRELICTDITYEKYSYRYFNLTTVSGIKEGDEIIFEIKEIQSTTKKFNGFFITLIAIEPIEKQLTPVIDSYVFSEKCWITKYNCGKNYAKTIKTPARLEEKLFRMNDARQKEMIVRLQLVFNQNNQIFKINFLNGYTSEEFKEKIQRMNKNKIIINLKNLPLLDPNWIPAIIALPKNYRQ